MKGGNTDERKQILSKTYLSRKDIKLLFDISRQVAERIYNQADQIDAQMLFRAYPNKVRMESVLTVTEKSFDLLQKQIKNADARQSNPQTI